MGWSGKLWDWSLTRDLRLRDRDPSPDRAGQGTG